MKGSSFGGLNLGVHFHGILYGYSLPVRGNMTNLACSLLLLPISFIEHQPKMHTKRETGLFAISKPLLGPKKWAVCPDLRALCQRWLHKEGAAEWWCFPGRTQECLAVREGGHSGRSVAHLCAIFFSSLALSSLALSLEIWCLCCGPLTVLAESPYTTDLTVAPNRNQVQEASC